MIPDKYWRKTTYMEGHIVFDGIHITQQYGAYMFTLKGYIQPYQITHTLSYKSNTSSEMSSSKEKDNNI